MRRRWIWTVFASLCALTLLLGWLSRPADQLELLKAYHPTKQTDHTLDEVLIELDRRSNSYSYVFPASTPPLESVLRSHLGRSSPFLDPGEPGLDWQLGPDTDVWYSPGPPQVVAFYDVPPKRTWFQARWDDLKKRLGW